MSLAAFSRGFSVGKKLGRGILAHVLAVCFVAVTLFAAFPQTAMAAAGDYNAGDIAIINAIIDNNGLQWAKADPADGSVVPADWTGVTWSADDTDKRITELNVMENGLTGVLNVSDLSALRYLICNQNQLTALKISGNTSLEHLDCHHNQLTSLDVSANNHLSFFAVHDNQLTSLDVSNCTKLTGLSCFNNNMPATPEWAGVTGMENIPAFVNGGSTNFHYYSPYGETPPAPPATETPSTTPPAAETPAPPAAAVDLAPPSGGEAGTAVPENTDLRAVAAGGGDVDRIAGLVAAQGISSNLVQTLDIKLYDAAGNPTSGACTIRVNIPGLTASDRVTILHLFDDGRTERIEAVERDGYATFRVGTFSLFGVVVANVKRPD